MRILTQLGIKIKKKQDAENIHSVGGIFLHFYFLQWSFIYSYKCSEEWLFDWLSESAGNLVNL